MACVGDQPRVGSGAAATSAGTTYRKLDYWCRTGVLGPRLAECNGSGPGRERWFTVEDVAVLAVIGRVSARFQTFVGGTGVAGSTQFFTLIAAATRSAIAAGDPAVALDLGDGQTYTILLPEPGE